jgi:hypothetical protein
MILAFIDFSSKEISNWTKKSQNPQRFAKRKIRQTQRRA